jgi:hypothetical protein
LDGWQPATGFGKNGLAAKVPKFTIARKIFHQETAGG